MYERKNIFSYSIFTIAMILPEAIQILKEVYALWISILMTATQNYKPFQVNRLFVELFLENMCISCYKKLLL